MTTKRLVRSRNGWIAGVCAGLAEYLGWSVDAVRIMYVLVSIISVAFPGCLVYIVLWILRPGPDSRESAVVE
jgi:phage shock protein PspC (stress-responsive transcriptional regulator)